MNLFLRHFYSSGLHVRSFQVTHAVTESHAHVTTQVSCHRRRFELLISSASAFVSQLILGVPEHHTAPEGGALRAVWLRAVSFVLGGLFHLPPTHRWILHLQKPAIYIT